jgi:hypothetical protein
MLYKRSNANDENKQKRIKKIDEEIIYTHQISRRKLSRKKKLKFEFFFEIFTNQLTILEQFVR